MAIQEFAGGAEPSQRPDIERRIRETLKKTLESFPGPPRQIGGQPASISPSSAGAPPPEEDQWDGVERETEPWLGWFRPPGAGSLPPHMVRKNAQ